MITYKISIATLSSFSNIKACPIHLTALADYQMMQSKCKVDSKNS